jgi:curved DNA-binding protein CbpA
MATERDPYQVLGLSSSASQAEITSAYRQLLREHHPDTRTRRAPADPAVDEHLQRILSAYALLRDPQHRAAHGRAVTEPGSHRTRCRTSAPTTGSDPAGRPDSHPCRRSRHHEAAAPTRDRIVGGPGALAPLTRACTGYRSHDLLVEVR